MKEQVYVSLAKSADATRYAQIPALSSHVQRAFRIQSRTDGEPGSASHSAPPSFASRAMAKLQIVDIQKATAGIVKRHVEAGTTECVWRDYEPRIETMWLM